MRLRTPLRNTFCDSIDFPFLFVTCSVEASVSSDRATVNTTSITRNELASETYRLP